jgi:hypothetical protein
MPRVIIGVVGNKVVCRPDPVRAKRKQKVEWTCKDGGFAADFGLATPFKKAGFAGAKGKRAGGPVRGDAVRGTYKYVVVVAKGDKALVADPRVII